MNVIHADGMPDAHIVNVVATYRLGLRLNLKKISYYLREIVPVKFNPKRFAAMTINLEAEGIDDTTALVFGSGNVVQTGAKTEEDSRLSAHYNVRFFNEVLGIPARLENFTITNMVCDMKVGFEVDLDMLKNDLGSRARYIPKNFPACRIRSDEDNKRVALVYWSGGVVLTGCKKREDICTMHRETFKLCKDHRYRFTGSVSKGEYRLINRKKATNQKNLNKINRNINIIGSVGASAKQTVTLGGPQINEDSMDGLTGDVDENIVDEAMKITNKKMDKMFSSGRIRGSAKNGVLYSRSIDPSINDDDEYMPMFIPSVYTNVNNERD